MGSNQKQTRILQLEQFQQQLARRTALLEEHDTTAADIRRDKIVKRLNGDIKRTKLAIASIEALETTVADARAKKEQNAQAKAAAPAQKGKNKKQDAPQPAEGGKKKKKGK